MEILNTWVEIKNPPIIPANIDFVTTNQGTTLIKKSDLDKIGVESWGFTITVDKNTKLFSPFNYTSKANAFIAAIDKINMDNLTVSEIRIYERNS